MRAFGRQSILRQPRKILAIMFATFLSIGPLPLNAQQDPFPAGGDIKSLANSVTQPVLANVSTCSGTIKGTWTGTLEFDISGDKGSTLAPTVSFQSGQSSAITNSQTTGNVSFTSSVANFGYFTVRPVGGSFTGDARVDYVCGLGNGLASSSGGGGGGNTTIVAPTDASGNVNVDCQIGCVGGSFATPSASPLPTASSGYSPPAQAPVFQSWMDCVYALGTNPAPSPGYGVTCTVDATGAIRMNIVNTVTVTGTVSNNCLTNCTPNPATAQAVSGTVTNNCATELHSESSNGASSQSRSNTTTNLWNCNEQTALRTAPPILQLLRRSILVQRRSR